MKFRHISRWVLSALVVLVQVACSPEAQFAPPTVGNPAPAFAAPELGADTISLADLRGDVVLLNVWATWCPPCREEMPSLEAIHQDLGEQGLRVVGVSIDSRGAAADVSRFLEETDISFTILHDADERVTRAFRTIGVPETFLIGRDGKILQRWIGKIDASSDAVRAPVKQALGTTLARID